MSDTCNIQLNNIPQELKDLKQWVYWKNVKGVKIPCDSITSTAKTNDQETWLDFAAVERYKEFGMAGIGFVLTDSDPFTIIDLDKCIETVNPNRFSMRVAEYFKSYTEISPSATGIHIVVKGKIKESIKRADIEVYSEKRYMCFTGDLVWNFEIRECQKELDAIFKKYKPVAVKRNYQSTNKNSNFFIISFIKCLTTRII